MRDQPSPRKASVRIAGIALAEERPASSCEAGCGRVRESERDVRFEAGQATGALREAMHDLASRMGRTIGEFEGLPLCRAYDLACESYPSVPEFWRVWKDWQRARPAPMGDL